MIRTESWTATDAELFSTTTIVLSSPRAVREAEMRVLDNYRNVACNRVTLFLTSSEASELRERDDTNT